MKIRTILVFVFIVLNGNDCWSQNAFDILNRTYQYYQGLDVYNADYQISYTSNIDTGSTTTEQIEISQFINNTKITSTGFISLSDNSSKLYIDHDLKEVTYIPMIVKSNSDDFIISYLDFYIKQDSSALKLSSDDSYYYIVVNESAKNINFIEYKISKSDFLINKITLRGQVHPILIADLNAQMQIEVLDFNQGKKAHLKKEDFLISDYIEKKNKAYTLKQFSDYLLTVLE